MTHPDKAKSYHSYRLRHYQAATGAPDEPSDARFVLEEISGEQRQQGFSSFEQVIEFLLDELRVPRKGRSSH